MNFEDFKEELINDTEILSKLEIIPKYLDNQKILYDIYNLCRKTYLTQFNSNFFKDDNGNFVSFTHNDAFKELGRYIESFISSLDENKNMTFQEVIIILKEYYIKTATNDEISKRTHVERYEDNKQQFGLYGIYYNFNQIDWDIFLKGLKENSNLN